MDNKRLEKLLVESMKNLLDQDDLGRVEGGVEGEHSHNTQFQWEDILHSFAIAVKDSEFFDSLNSSFYKVHSYKWINDSTFEEALTSELESQGVPHKDINLAMDALDSVRSEYLKDHDNENSVGWAPNLDDIKSATQNPHNNKVSDGETFDGDNKPYAGVEPNNTRPSYNEA